MNFEKKDIFWHSSAHLMAHAVKNLYPNVKFAIGPAIENGFYYDFDNLSINDEELIKIEKEMKKLVEDNLNFEKYYISKEEAFKKFKNQPYKIDLINNLKDKKVSIYKLGEFEDLCKGPHLDNIKNIKSIKLLKIAGSYWKGNSDNKMLTRIYGISFPDKKMMKEYLYKLEEAKKNDHRIIGKNLDLFSFHEEAPGSVFWHEKGWIIYNEIIDFWRKEHRKHGFKEVNTPQLMNKKLWEQSGHWDLYSENMFTSVINEKEYALKPMSCPGNILYYKEKKHSYNEFPLRIAELGHVHRNELSGVLHGLMRVKQFTQDDSHIFVSEDILKDELKHVISMALDMLKKFGFEKFKLDISVRSEDKKWKYLGDDDIWEKAENTLKESLKDLNLDYSLQEGEAKFYGPSIDIMIKDSMDREWQCSTIQLDFNLPKRFELKYINSEGKEEVPIMIHRTLLGSIERFIGVLLEHYKGVLPSWLSPVQIAILPVSEKNIKYSEKIREELEENGVRAEIKIPNDSLGKRIRNSNKEKIPYFAIIGNDEEKENILNIRKYGENNSKKYLLKDFLEEIKQKI